jgi:hypothetical protein
MLIVSFFLYTSCTTQKSTTTTEVNTAVACKGNWRYVSLTDTVSGIIAFYEQPIVHCGVVSTASVGLIKTNSGKIIRVLSLCNIKKDFQTPNQFVKGDSVIIAASETPKFRVDLIPIDPEVCTLKYAYFGTIWRVK